MLLKIQNKSNKNKARKIFWCDYSSSVLLTVKGISVDKCLKMQRRGFF